MKVRKDSEDPLIIRTRTTSFALANPPYKRAEKVKQFIEKYVPVPEGMLVGKPMKLLPEQIGFIHDVYDNQHSDKKRPEEYGLLRTRRAIFSLPRKNGKALALSTPLPTPDGWTTMGRVEVGDYVLGADGQRTKVTFKSEVHVGNRCFLVVTDDGNSIVADSEHLWKIRTDGVTRGVWKTVDTLRLDEFVNHRAGAVAFPLASECSFEEAELDIPPYTLGFWLGDGNSKGAALTIGDQDFEYVLGRVESEVGFIVLRDSAYRKPGSKCVTINLSDGVRNRGDKTKLTPRMRAMSLLYNKHIPQIYLRASAAQRWSLLQGLMDSDGSCDIGNGNPRCVFSNKMEQVSLGVFELAKTLGLKATYTVAHNLIYGPTYIVSFCAFADQRVFGLERKQKRLKPRPSKPSRSMFSYVRSITELPSQPTQCIQVEAEDSLYLAGRGFTVTHNTGLISALVCAHTIGPEAKENSNVYSAARSRDQAALVFNYSAKSLRMNKKLEGLVQITDSSKKIVGLRRNVMYKSLSAESATAHGLSPALTIHDELGQVIGPNDRLYDALETAGGAQLEPLSFIISTQAAGEADLLSTIIDDGLLHNSPDTVVHLYCAMPEDDIFDPEVWLKANFALDKFRGRKDLELLAAQAKRMPTSEATFRNLYLNMRTALISKFMAVSVWKANDTKVIDDLFYNNPVHAGLDLSQKQDLTAAVLSVQDPETGIVHVKTYVYTPAPSLDERAKRDKAPYAVWVKQGHMIAVGSVVVDYRQVVQHLKIATDGMTIASVSFDRWRIEIFKPIAEEEGWAQDDGCEWIPVGQGFQDMSPRLETVETLALQHNIAHGDSPPLNSAANSAIALTDPAGNKKLDKSKSSSRIDAFVAMVMSVHACHNPTNTEEFTEDDLLFI